MAWRDVPALLRHCVVAVYGKSTGGGPDGVVRAFKICRDKLAQQGYLYPRGRNQILEDIRETGKGFVRSMQHVHEGVHGAQKDEQFAQLFAMIEPRLWEYDGPGGKQPPKDQPSLDAQPGLDDERRKIVGDIQPLNIPNIGGYPFPMNKPPKK